MQEVNTELKERVAVQKGKVKREKMLNTICKSKNQYLSYRSRELSKLKLDSLFSQRTVQLVDNANFSDFFGNVDQVLLEARVNITHLDESVAEAMDLLCLTPIHELSKTTLSNGEIVALKSIKQRLKYNNEKSLTLLTHEAKILCLLKSHRNIVFSHGIGFVEAVPSLILCFESNATLKLLLKKRELIDHNIIRAILEGLCDDVVYIHQKGILHNQIIPENICLRYNSQSYDPVLVGFSCLPCS